MFDIGFSELMLIGVVALIVVGPERLPKVARTAGHMLGRLQRYVSDVKSDIQREMQIEELKKLQGEMRDSARELESSMRSQVAEMKSTIEESTADARSSIAELESQLEKSRNATPSPSAAELQSAYSQDAPEGAADRSRIAEAGPQLELGLASEAKNTSKSS